MTRLCPNCLGKLGPVMGTLRGRPGGGERDPNSYSAVCMRCDAEVSWVKPLRQAHWRGVQGDRVQPYTPEEP